ncbi:cytidylate kinase-like family protein [Butyrivibrio sp. MC2013]|uniref:cytidylate kinase-like family protein n=1 Tax=Butyrivibrio sp. MC2013 TaxID=1280686 RepID=UPI00040DA3F1|nr:cytidylate kinase-like family protein [Butyrivibrio sp. MC2013]
MKKIVVTIARQYGSGGRTVGEMLAEDLGIHYYDKELMKLASDESGISEQLFVQADENVKATNPLVRKVKKSIYKGQLLKPESEDFTSDKNLFNYQAEIVKKLAETEPCVIVGRCADYVLRDYDNVASVFVHAPHDFLMEQAAKKQPMRGRELEKYIEKVDKYRADYYEYYTGEKWEDARNYDLCLNSGRLGFEKCVEAIKAYLKVRFGEDVFD